MAICQNIMLMGKRTKKPANIRKTWLPKCWPRLSALNSTRMWRGTSESKSSKWGEISFEPKTSPNQPLASLIYGQRWWHVPCSFHWKTFPRKRNYAPAKQNDDMRRVSAHASFPPTCSSSSVDEESLSLFDLITLKNPPRVWYGQTAVRPCAGSHRH